jgi:hypothetical protein
MNKCEFCNQTISKFGAARTSHLRKHVREGILEEKRTENGLQFVKSTGPRKQVVKQSFGKMECPACREEISRGGAAYVSHMRRHVRKQEIVEHRTKKKIVFLTYAELDNLAPYTKLGEEPLPGQPKEVWDITEALAALKAIDPATYFTTSGEAVKKADKLVTDLYSLSILARGFRDRLKKARGIKKFLETARENGKLLLVKAKDPRIKVSTEDENQETT